MPRTHRYNATEQKIVDLADRVIANPAASPSELTAAMRSLERVIAKAERRTKNRPPAADPVDVLVRELEGQPKAAVQPEPADPIQAVQDIADGKKPAAVPVPDPEPVCRLCGAVGPWNTRWPIGDPNGKLLCTVCFGELCAIAARGTPAEPPPNDWAKDFAASRNLYSSDYQKSVEIWQQQARDNADCKEQEAREHAAAEAEYHKARTRWIQNGGRL
jgi:hypothetical protein